MTNRVWPASSVRIEIDGELNLGSATASADSIWDERDDTSFDADVLHVGEVHESGDVLVLRCAVTRYRYLWADRKQPQLGLGISSLGVSGITIRSDGRVLVGTRSTDSFQYGGWNELVPSGSVDVVLEPIDHHGVLIRELQEETILRPEHLMLADLGVAFDAEARAYDIAVAVDLHEEVPDRLPDSDEYTSLRFLTVDGVQRLNRLIWTSTAILDLWQRKERA